MTVDEPDPSEIFFQMVSDLKISEPNPEDIVTNEEFAHMSDSALTHLLSDVENQLLSMGEMFLPKSDRACDLHNLRLSTREELRRRGSL